MRLPPLLFTSLLLAIAGCGDPGRQVAPDGSTAASTDAAATDGPAEDLAAITRRAADAVCGALYRCCDADLVDYFAPYVANERLAAFHGRLPPASPLDEGACRDVMREMLDTMYLGEWVEAAETGEVTFDGAGFAGCVGDLGTATCGIEARTALWDSTCFGLAAPAGGEEQRRFVRRTRGAGASCGPVRDGLGGVFYGTCDPAAAFCCYQDPARPGCQFPFDGNGGTRPGSCQAVAAVGRACSAAPPLALCATGVNCDAEDDTCVDPPEVSLANGATCVDGSYNLLGTCSDGWCDVLGTRRCEPRRADGATCFGADECTSGLCRTTCQPNLVCTDAPHMVDAGVDAMAVDAGVADAAADASPDASAADGERCASAFGLIGSSVASPQAGYTHRVAASFGAANDYNPYRSALAMRPPDCSFVYDARGLDKVYQVTLQPGERLALRVELAGGRQAGVYLLDTCPGGSWPDFDGSGACGNNEYGAGFCGPLGCDAAALSVLYPTTIGGVATAPASFWIVVDQVGGDDATGFVLDWRITGP